MFRKKQCYEKPGEPPGAFRQAIKDAVRSMQGFGDDPEINAILDALDSGAKRKNSENIRRDAKKFLSFARMGQLTDDKFATVSEKE